MPLDDVTQTINVLEEIKHTLNVLAIYSGEDRNITEALYQVDDAINNLKNYICERENGFQPW